jgi:YidC/Oxa1 family membrane protein insertase
MEKRALIAVAISVAILVLYQEVVLRRLYPPPPPGEEQVSETPTAAEPTLAPPTPEAVPESAPPASRPNPAAAAQHITVETDLYKAVFTSTGARLESLRLKKYRTTVNPDSPLQEMIVPAPDGELPFGVELRGAQVLSDSGAAYSVQGGDLTLHSDEEGTLDFVWSGESVTLHKRFSFSGDRYEFSAKVGARNVPHDYNELGISWVKGIDTQPKSGSEVIFDHIMFLDGRKVTDDPFDKLSAGKVVTGDIQWAAFSGRYFLAAMIPIEPQNQRLWLKLRDSTMEEKLLFPISSSAIEQGLSIFVGPKDIDVLDRVGESLARAANLGWFSFIAVPLLHELKFSHAFTGNYGVDIILLTVIIKILFIPLTQKSFRSMREMQKLQPQMAKIRERFKDNSEQMNKEIMEMYRRHKVNPLGGCLPMVLQVPVFIGLYEALLNTIELRHAPFMLWINDLSAPDRLGGLQLPFVEHPGIPVLTLLMGVSMFVQQWMTPSTGDPTQQRVMMIMPLAFTFMFVNFPSGLALYWLVNNLLTIAQQFYMNRTAT